MRRSSRPASREALHDFIYVIRTPVPHKLGIMGACAALTYVLVWLLLASFSTAKPHKPPQIIYVKQWPKSRTLAQIEAQQKIDAVTDAKARAKEEAEEKAAAAERQAQFKRAEETLKHYGI